MSNKDLAHDPHLRQRGFLVTKEHPEVGQRIHLGVPYSINGRPLEVNRPAPLLGADTDAVLTELLGLKPDQIERLRGLGALD
jgi:crotonobetainyl-CoA:carnitine CoA-transferase CaiB-like acyl-CoA transferase